MPARRLAACTAATLLAAGPAALATAGAAHATGDHGRAGAVVLRAGLDVSLLNKTVDVPLHTALNEVQAPRSAERTALTARLDGVDQGRPFQVLRADVATSEATVDAHKAQGYTHLARARVHVPGLPLLSLIEVEKVTSKAVCAVGEHPVAESNVLGHVTVLGKKVTLSAGGRTEVKVPGVGEVTLDLSKRSTTSRTAAASALELKVSVNPLKLNVADVQGTITLAGATCETPDAPHDDASEPAAPAPHTKAPHKEEPAGHAPEREAKAQGAPERPATTGGEDLAETGGSSMTPYLAGGAVLLVAAGGGVVMLTRGRRRRG
ncbi:SCO1860 family LAETG-anchored protein [Streptomyces tsukubensis]